MANEPPTSAIEPDAPSDDEYQAFRTALSATARGRAFLAEHGRRERAADTVSLLTAIRRLETLVHSQAIAPTQIAPAGSVNEELRGLLEAIYNVRAEIDIGGLAQQIVKLGALIDVVQQRIEAAVGHALSIPHSATDKQAGLADVTGFGNENDPPPAPLAAERAAEAEVRKPVTRNASEERPAFMPEVAWGQNSAASARAEPLPSMTPASTATLAIAAVVELAAAESAKEADAEPEVMVIKAGTVPPPPSFTGDDFSATPPHMITRSRPADALTPITMLSEEERTALFT